MNGVSSTSMIVEVTPWWKTVIANINVILGCLVALGVVGCVATYKKEEPSKAVES